MKMLHGRPRLVSRVIMEIGRMKYSKYSKQQILVEAIKRSFNCHVTTAVEGIKYELESYTKIMIKRWNELLLL
jgi:hypothetical protein